MKRGMKGLCSVFAGFLMVAIALTGVFCASSVVTAHNGSNDQYELWKMIGEQATVEGLSMIMKKSLRYPARNQIIALSNAGYAEVNGQTTMAALDGLSEITRVSRGANTLLEVHSAPEAPLWFAIYDKKSGYCAYLEVNPGAVGSSLKATALFSIRSVEKIKADYLFSKYFPVEGKTTPTFSTNFGTNNANEFRIVTIANAVAAGVPAYAVRAFEFHNHYCPGVTSGIMMAQVMKERLANAGGAKAWFVQGLQPWCKEDALMVMLNATPGKSGYAATYSTAADWADWELGPRVVGTNNIYPASIIYAQKADNTWEGLVLDFSFNPDPGNVEGTTPKTADGKACSAYTNTTINKLCSDLWYLEKLDDSDFIKEYLMHPRYKITLLATDHPKNYAKPGVDVMKALPPGETMSGWDDYRVQDNEFG